MGMHSNDVRGTTITEEPVDRAQNSTAASTPLGASPLLVRTRGAEIGIRTKAIANLDSSVSVFLLDQASELVFNGDGGDTSPSRPSQRYGVEWTNNYQPTRWLALDANIAATRARFVGFDDAQAQLYASLAGFPQAQIGNAPGNDIPNAPALVMSTGVTLGDKTGWFGALRWRYLGTTPLTEDDAFRSPPTSVFNGRIGYRFDNGWRIQLDALNLLNTKTNQITYAYGSLIKTDSLYAACLSATPPPTAVCQNGIMDSVLHPIEPLAFRMKLVGAF
jgi:outer membrane receptor protein involved in Fe transport